VGRVCDINELKTIPSGVQKPVFPVDIGEMYEGERIRKPQMQLEFGGLKAEKKWELVLARRPEEIEDARIIIEGPDISELEAGGSYPIGILVEVAGDKVEKDIEGVLERRLHYFLNYIQGVMHVNQRYDVWIRVSQESYRRGLTSFEWIGKALIWLYKTSFPAIQKVQVTFYTNLEQVAVGLEKAMQVWGERDERARKLMDEDVQEFYGCTMCQSFAPTHMCVITPNRTGSCGSISWFDARAAANIDPKGPNFPIPKGDVIDPEKGIYEGVNKVIQEKTLGAIKNLAIYSMFEDPHTSCGCFEGIAFYIPEVEGIGVVHRDFRGEAVNGLTFSAMASHTSGGVQSPGFNGIAIEYLRSPRFLKPDGGWTKVVWMPSVLKERVKDAIPPDLTDKIATEESAKNLTELRAFLAQKSHPVVQRWAEKKAVEEAQPAPEESSVEAAVSQPSEGEAVIHAPTLYMPTVGGFKIILKNAKITAEKVIIKRLEKK